MEDFRDLDRQQVFNILAFDPGGTTGWAILSIYFQGIYWPEEKIFDNVCFTTAGQFTGPEDWIVDQMVDLVSGWPDDATIVVEDFILRAYRRDRALLSPVRISAAFQNAVRWVGRRKTGRPSAENGWSGARPIFYQQPALAMTTMTDDRLRMVNMYEPLKAQPHARDAFRHAATYARRVKAAYDAKSATPGVVEFNRGIEMQLP